MIKSKIAIIQRAIPPEYSGAGKRALKQAQALSQFFEIDLYTFTRNHKHCDMVNIKTIGCKNYYSERGRVIRKILNLPAVIFYLLRNINTQYKLIHCIEGIGSFLTYICVIIAKMRGIPVSVGCTLDGSDDPYSLRRSLFGKHKYRLLCSVNLHICLSPRLYNKYMETGFCARSVKLIPNSVDINKFCCVTNDSRTILRRQLNIDCELTVFIMVGAVIKRKGVDEVVKALCEHFDSSKFMLLLVGPYDIEVTYYRSIIDYVVKNGYTNCIRFTGSISEPEMYYQVADIFILNSESEGMPNSVIEAQSCGLPVFMREIPGISDFIISHKYDGIIYNGINELCDELNNFLTDTKTACTLRERAMFNAESRFSETKVISRYYDAFMEVIDRCYPMG